MCVITVYMLYLFVATGLCIFPEMTPCVVQRVCADCGRHHCSKCVMKSASNELRCRQCDRLASGAVPRNELMRYRVKDLRRFLAKRHIPTEHCTEKTDLVELILRSTNREQFEEQQELQRQRIQELQVTHTGAAGNTNKSCR